MDNVESVLAAFGLKTTGGGAVVAFAGWAFSSAAAAWFGAVVGLVGLCVTWHFNRKRDAREQREHEARMKGLA